MENEPGKEVDFMNYTQELPNLDNLNWIAGMAGSFPVSAGAVRRLAETWKLNKSVVDFLKLFPEDEEFDNREDFITRCEDLELIIKEERDMPYESVQVLKED